MNSAHWLAYFRQNRLERPEPDWKRPVAAALSGKREIADSLSHFQLGESGEGRFLLAEARRSYPDDADYCAALDLFIKEEQEHARLLAQLVRRFDGRLITRHWTHSVFRLLRRALGVDFEIQVLVIAELVGTSYYRLLRRCTTDPVVAEVCDLLLRDEARHIEFHRDRFTTDQRAWLPLERAAWAVQFQALFLGAAAVAWVDHGRALRAAGATRREFLTEARAECIQLLDALAVSPAPASPHTALPANPR